MKFLISTAAAALLATSAAMAQMAPGTKPAGTATNMAECQANFKAADKNSNGNLDRAEIDGSKALIPIALGTANTISMQEFVTACGNTSSVKSGDSSKK